MSFYSSLRQVFTSAPKTEPVVSPDDEARWVQLVGLLRDELARGGQAPEILENDYQTRNLALPIAGGRGIRFTLTVTAEQLNGDLPKFAHDVYGVYQRQVARLERQSETAEPQSPEDQLGTWLKNLMARFQPDQLHFGPGETLGAAFQRIISEEETRIQSDPQELKAAKMRTLEALREKFPITD